METSARARPISESESAADVLGSTYEIDVCGVKVKAEASLKPMYDPKSERVKV